MKAFFVTLVALHAVLAAALPAAEPVYPVKSEECSCLNAAGQTRASGICQYMRGAINGPGEWCYPATTTTVAMNTVFTDDWCVRQWGPEFNRAVCRPILLCQGLGGPNFYKLC